MAEQAGFSPLGGNDPAKSLRRCEPSQQRRAPRSDPRRGEIPMKAKCMAGECVPVKEQRAHKRAAPASEGRRGSNIG